MKYSLAFSPCPNDTFMFWDILHNSSGRDTDIEYTTMDIEQLNLAAEQELYDIIKISYAHYPRISSSYQLLDSGSALGFGNGPLLISRRKIYPDEIPHLNIAVPGVYTTANLLLSIAYPDIKNKKEYLFSDIEAVVLDDEVDAGLLIHETRFTYEKKGLKKILDLGEYWEGETGLPLPLGGIAIRRSIGQDEKKGIEKRLSEGISYVLNHPELPMPFVTQHAQSMDTMVCRKHIGLYVNEFSVSLKGTGKKAVNAFFAKGKEAGLFAEMTEPVFVDSGS